MTDHEARTFETPRRTEKPDEALESRTKDVDSASEKEFEEELQPSSNQKTSKKQKDFSQARTIVLFDSQNQKQKFDLHRDSDFHIERRFQILRHLTSNDDDFATDEENITTAAEFCLEQLKGGAEAEFGSNLAPRVQNGLSGTQDLDERILSDSSKVTEWSGNSFGVGFESRSTRNFHNQNRNFD